MSTNTTIKSLPLTPRSKKALALAAKAARRHNCGYIGVEHILYGLASDNSRASLMLEQAGITPSSIAAEIGLEEELQQSNKTNMSQNTESIKRFLVEKLGLKSRKPHVTDDPFPTIMETDTNILLCTDDMLNPSSALDGLECECIDKIKKLNDIIDDINSCRAVFCQKKD